MATLVTLILLVLSACGKADPATGNTTTGDPLNGTSWVLVAYRKTKPLSGTTITATFEDGQVRGSAGCNTYGGSYKVSERTIAVGPVAITEMACLEPKGVMKQEQEYVQYITDAQTFRLVDGQLQIFWTDHEALIFEPQG
jgi:heat shock protein HslJ